MIDGLAAASGPCIGPPRCPALRVAAAVRARGVLAVDKDIGFGYRYGAVSMARR